MTDEEAAREAEQLAKLHDPPYQRVRCTCDGGVVRSPTYNDLSGEHVQACDVCDGRLYAWKIAPRMDGRPLSDRQLIERLSKAT